MTDKRCLDYRKRIKESEQQLRSLERGQSKALLRDRMRFLRLLKSGECTSQAKAGKQIGLGLRGAEKLWQKYIHQGVKGLLTYPYTGKKEKLSEEQKQQLRTALCDDQMQSLEQVCQYVAAQNGVSYTNAGMFYVLRRMKAKKKTGRPLYYNKDKKGEKRFKKKTFPT